MFHNDVVGSLLRPSYLKNARDQFAAGKLTDAEFKQIEDRAVDDCINLQVDAAFFPDGSNVPQNPRYRLLYHRSERRYAGKSR